MAAAEAVLAPSCAFTGAVDDAETHRRAAGALVDSMPDEELAGRLDAIGHLAATEMYLERFEETVAHAGRGIAVARAGGHGGAFPTMFPCLGTSLWVLGRLEESADVLDGAVESARLSGNAQGLAWSLLNRAVSALMAGDIERARTFGDEAFAVSRGLGDSFVVSYAGIMQSWVSAENGDPTSGVELAVEAGGGEDLPRIPGGWRATHLEVLARCWLALGRLDRAEVAAERARAVADMVQLPRSRAMAHKATAEVALYAGDAETAVEHARASVEAAEKVSARLDAALSRVLLGRALAANGQTGLAIGELERAAADLESYGATRWRDEAEQELRRLGHRIHRRSQPGKAHGDGIESLSGRELEVVRLVVDRRTNVEIAGELFLSLRTVETHLRNIFRKLGVSSRAEAARAVERATAT
jgi:ATP/maltotriose-dependent transcriptional regulator MalT